MAGRAFTATQRLGKPARAATTRPRDLFDLTPTDEQQMFREAVTGFAAKHVRPAALAADAACETPASLIAEAAELGLATLGVPADLGGAMDERATVTTVIVAEALAHGDLGVALALLAPGGVASALGLWGDADQQATYLPAFTGEDPPAAALAILEPDPLFDPFTLRTTARPADGGGWILDGVKALVPRAAACELLLVAADCAGKGPALFLVESGAGGISVEGEPAMGLRPAATARLTFEGTTVPAGALLADGDPAVYAEAVQRARLGWCGLAVGCAQAVLDYVIPYVNERVAFGEPISHRQAVAFGVADIAIELEGMKLLTLRAAALADAGKPFAHAVAVAREACVSRGMEIGSAGVQLLGGHGYVKEHPVERWYRDLRAAGVVEGALLV